MVIGLSSLQLERKGNTLTLQWESNGLWFGALFVGFALIFILGVISHYSVSEVAFSNGLLLCTLFGAGGLLATRPRRVKTIFDLSTRQLTRRSSIAYGRYERSYVIPFEEVLALKVSKESAEGGSYYEACIMLDNGQSQVIGQSDTSTKMFEQADMGTNRCSLLIRDVCAATGLRMLDV